MPEHCKNVPRPLADKITSSCFKRITRMYKATSLHYLCASFRRLVDTVSPTTCIQQQETYVTNLNDMMSTVKNRQQRKCKAPGMKTRTKHMAAGRTTKEKPPQSRRKPKCSKRPRQDLRVGGVTYTAVRTLSGIS